MSQNIITAFPGYRYDYFNGSNKPTNIYRDTDIGSGGYIYANPGMYINVALLDIVSLHPNSIRAMNCFGDYTKNFTDLLDARVAIKRKNFDTARNMLNGRLKPYLNDESQAKDLAQALKIAINSVYGLTAANFDNPFRDIRNKNNIVACRGALFMRTLQDEVEQRGYKIVAIRTDSIKIADADKEIIDFCMSFAKKYGYEFEHEVTYDKMCQVNDADYIAKYKDPDWCEKIYGYIPGDNKKNAGEWTATGAQFAVPYVFKTLFSKEPINFNDLCETKSVKSSLYLDMNESLPYVEDAEKELAKLETLYKKEQVSEEEYTNKKDALAKLIDIGHDYKFVGRVGQFCPILPGKGGGELVRDQNGKYYSVTGTKGYRWLESEMVRGVCEENIDRSYYNSLVDAAVETISQYGDFEWFVSDDTDILDKKVLHNSKPPCGDKKFETCFDCPKFDNNECKMGYSLENYIYDKRHFA